VSARRSNRSPARAVGQRRCQRAETVIDGFGDRRRPRIEVCSSDLNGINGSSKDLILLSSEVSRLATRFERSLELQETLVGEAVFRRRLRSIGCRRCRHRFQLSAIILRA